MYVAVILQNVPTDRGGVARVLRVREHPLAPRRQKHPLEIKEKLHETLCNTKMQQKYDDLSSNQGKSMIRTAKSVDKL